MKKSFNSGYKPSLYTHISNTEYLAIVENDDCGVLKIMSFNTERELDEFASKVEDGFNHVTKYKANKIP